MVENPFFLLWELENYIKPEVDSFSLQEKSIVV